MTCSALELTESEVRQHEDWTDQEVLDGCLRRDEGAWRELMRRFDRSLRVVIFKIMRKDLKSIPSDFRDDIMGDFYVRILQEDMTRLRCFDWSKGSALFSWLALIVGQCASEYRDALFSRPQFTKLKTALDVPDEGGVLMSGYKGPEGSLHDHVARMNRKQARDEAKEARKERRNARARAREAVRLADAP